MDIVIYTNPETLLHKREPHCECWWLMGRRAIKLQEKDRIYFAIRGEVQGYFICTEIEDWSKDEFKIYWNSDSWVQLGGAEAWRLCKPFRGFRYRWWDTKEE